MPLRCLANASAHLGSRPRAALRARRHLLEMPVSEPLAKKRALVKVLLTLAAFYSVHVTVTRDSADSAVLGAYRRVSLKAHPDKRGSLEHCQMLNNAKTAWDAARRGKGKGGRPRKQGGTQAGDGGGRGPAGPRAAAETPCLKGGGSRAWEMVSLRGHKCAPHVLTHMRASH